MLVIRDKAHAADYYRNMSSLRWNYGNRTDKKATFRGNMWWKLSVTHVPVLQSYEAEMSGHAEGSTLVDRHRGLDEHVLRQRRRQCAECIHVAAKVARLYTGERKTLFTFRPSIQLREFKKHKTDHQSVYIINLHQPASLNNNFNIIKHNFKALILKSVPIVEEG